VFCLDSLGGVFGCVGVLSEIWFTLFLVVFLEASRRGWSREAGGVIDDLAMALVFALLRGPQVVGGCWFGRVLSRWVTQSRWVPVCLEGFVGSSRGLCVTF